MRFKKIIAFAASMAVLATTIVPVNCLGLDPAHVIDGYEVYEPLFVHTPVISPVVITDGEGHAIPDKGKGRTELRVEFYSTLGRLNLLLFSSFTLLCKPSLQFCQ